MWSDKHYGRHFLIYLSTAWTCYHEACHEVTLPGPRHTNDIVKVMGSEVKVTDNIFYKCAFLAEAH